MFFWTVNDLGVQVNLNVLLFKRVGVKLCTGVTLPEASERSNVIHLHVQ